jgi:hypothetical protein
MAARHQDAAGAAAVLAAEAWSGRRMKKRMKNPEG